MADLLGLSARYIDQGIFEGPASINRVTTELSEIADRIAVIESFSHVVVFRTDAGLLLFDTSVEGLASGCLKSLRAWADDPVNTIAYTHGHMDHVGGAHSYVTEARDRGRPDPRIVGHENVPPRLERYERTNGYNAVINERQFGRGGRSRGGLEGMTGGARFGPSSWVNPDLTFREQMRLQIGGLDVELRHARGETDDHLWAWIPERKAICAGDFVIWVFPNAGNPQKVQRYPLEWSRALREMSALDAELLLPAHGLPVAGADRIRTMLGDMASALESVVEQTLALMNEGVRLDEIVHSVRISDDLMQKPYLRPTYDEPEFVVRNVWRLYGGWYDGNPAHLKPPRETAFAAEVAQLSGGVRPLIERAQTLSEGGGDGLRLACQLVEIATQAAPDDTEAHAARARIYEARRKSELSLMARGIYGHAARESAQIADPSSAR